MEERTEWTPFTLSSNRPDEIHESNTSLKSSVGICHICPERFNGSRFVHWVRATTIYK